MREPPPQPDGENPSKNPTEPSRPTDPVVKTPAGWSRKLIQYGGFATAILLLAGAIYFAAREGDFSALRDAEAKWVAALLGTMLLSAVLVNGVLFWLVNKPYADPDRPVRLNDMHALIAGSGLLNYTPVKAGLVGRLAYLKHKHGITYKASVLIQLMIGGSMVAAFLSVILATAWRERFDTLWWASLALALPLFAAVGSLLVQRMLPRRPDPRADAETREAAALRHPLGWTFAHLLFWIVVALSNVFITGARWWFVGKIMDEPLSVRDAVLMSVLHNSTSALPANGLGAREALVGLLFGGEAPADFVALALVDRAAEAMVLVPAGLLSLVYLHRRGMRIRPRTNEPA